MPVLAGCFYWVLNMSILGAVTGLAVLALRKIRRLPRGLAYGLWLIPAVRFAVPVGITSEFSLMTWIFRLTGKAAQMSDQGFPGMIFQFPVFSGKTIPVYQEPRTELEISSMNMIGAVNNYSSMTYRTDTLEQVFHTASVVWIAAAGIAAFICILFYAAAKAEIKDAVKKDESVFVSRRAAAPAVYGIFRPKIVIPESMADQDLTYILLHERIHIRRKDNLWRCFAVAICCMHWFNPLVWIFFRDFLEDMELSCDSRVLAGLPEAGRKEYALAILRGAEQKTLFAVPFGGAKVRNRIAYMLSWRRLTAVSFCFFALFAAAVAIALTTNASM